MGYGILIWDMESGEASSGREGKGREGKRIVETFMSYRNENKSRVFCFLLVDWKLSFYLLLILF